MWLRKQISLNSLLLVPISGNMPLLVRNSPRTTLFTNPQVYSPLTDIISYWFYDWSEGMSISATHSYTVNTSFLIFTYHTPYSHSVCCQQKIITISSMYICGLFQLLSLQYMCRLQWEYLAPIKVLLSLLPVRSMVGLLLGIIWFYL